MGDRRSIRKWRRPFHQTADDFSRQAIVDVGIKDKVLPESRLAYMDHNGAIGEVDVMKGVDHPLPFDEGGGADGLEEVLVVEELRRQRSSLFGRSLQLFHIHGERVIHPVFGHRDYRYEKHYPGKLSLRTSRLPYELSREARDLQL